MSAQGFIKLHRTIVDWEWYKNPIVKDVFLHLLLIANHQQNEWQGTLIQQGQVLTGRKEFALATGLSEQNVRTGWNKLKSTSEITIKSTNRFSLITIVKWQEYQGALTSKSTSKLTNNQPTTNQQLTTNKNVKNDKKKNIYVPPEGGTTPSGWKPEYGKRYISAFNELFESHYVLTPARTAKLKLRFKTFKSEEIGQALINLSKSKFHRGDNDRGWKASPDFLIKSDEQVDIWLNKGGSNEN